MERITGDVETVHLGSADLDAFLVGGGVERALDSQTGLGHGRADRLDDGKAIGELGLRRGLGRGRSASLRRRWAIAAVAKTLKPAANAITLNPRKLTSRMTLCLSSFWQGAVGF